MTARPLHLPAHLPDAAGPLWKLPVGDGRFVGPRDQVRALEAQLAVHAEQVAAVRVAEARETWDEEIYDALLPLLRRKSVPKTVPARFVERYQREAL